MKMIATEHHRNGVCGRPFTVSIIQDGDRRMLVVNFDSPDGANDIACAAFDLDMLAEGNIRFGENSWRGDHWQEHVLRLAPKEEAA